MKLAHALAAVTVLFVAAAAPAADEPSEAAGYLQKAYPPAEAGMVRYAILLPKKEKEADVKVELIVGKTVTVDSANAAWFDGTIETVKVGGWGLDRYVVTDLGAVRQTLRGGGRPEERFVKLKTILVRYNSLLPVVVYVPAGAEVRYRVWTAAPEATPVTRG